MRRHWRLAVVGIAVITPLPADWKITTSTTDDRGIESVRTEYYKGQLWRSDSSGVRESPLVFVMDQEGRALTIWDVKRKEYMSVTPHAVSREILDRRVDARSWPVLLVETSTTDTGERQTLFGRTATHLITSEKRSGQQAPDAEMKLESESVTDAWYIDASGLPVERRGTFSAMLVLNGQVPEVRRTHTGPAPSGMAVRETRTWRLLKLSITTESEMEVKELQEGPLSPALFMPPADFKRVDKLSDTSLVYQPSFSDEIQMYWNSFENWLFSWFS